MASRRARYSSFWSYMLTVLLLSGVVVVFLFITGQVKSSEEIKEISERRERIATQIEHTFTEQSNTLINEIEGVLGQKLNERSKHQVNHDFHLCLVEKSWYAMSDEAKTLLDAGKVYELDSDDSQAMLDVTFYCQQKIAENF